MYQKKWGFGLLGLIAAAAIYYLITGYIQSGNRLDQVTKLKQQVNAQLTQMQTNGFTLSDRKIQKEKEHFVIRLDAPDKASVFLTQKGIHIKKEEAEELKGLKLAVDIAYLTDTIAVELYPVALPINLQSMLRREKDQNILVQIEEMLKKKTFFAHIDIDHGSTTFQGYIKDITEILAGEKEVKLTLQGFHFSGNIKDLKIVKLEQTFHSMHLYIQNLIDRYISGLQKHYEYTGPTVYDYTTDYTIEKIKINEAPEAVLLADKISLFSASSVKNGLAFQTLQTKVENIELMLEKEKLGMSKLFLDMNMSNLDVAAFETLQKTDPSKKKEYDALAEKILSNNIHIEIPKLSIDKITLHGKEINGFSLRSQMDIDKSLDFYRFSLNPKHALSKIDANIELSLSKEILAMIKEKPEVMLLYMMYRPKRVYDKRIYDLDLKNGYLKINGKDFKLNGKQIKF